MFKLLLILSLMFFPPAYAKKSKKKTTTQPIITQSRYIQSVIRKGLPGELCKDKSRLLRCYNISKAICHKVVGKSLNRCIKTTKSKKQYRGIASLGYSRSLGACTKNTVDKKIKKKRRFPRSSRTCRY